MQTAAPADWKSRAVASKDRRSSSRHHQRFHHPTVVAVIWKSPATSDCKVFASWRLLAWKRDSRSTKSPCYHCRRQRLLLAELATAASCAPPHHHHRCGGVASSYYCRSSLLAVVRPAGGRTRRRRRRCCFRSRTRRALPRPRGAQYTVLYQSYSTLVNS